MTKLPMRDAEFQEIVARLRAGNRIAHPEHLPLYAETRASRSELSAEGDRFVWTTYFHEHAPGHGWSVELTEQKNLDEAALRALFEG